QKSKKFDWEEKAEAAFQLLKQKLCSASILALPEGSENFVVYCDARQLVLSNNSKAVSTEQLLLNNSSLLVSKNYYQTTPC
ncbi:putative reverse transcriptase domain-containing protein, partial [Tanacetum coccineum]